MPSVEALGKELIDAALDAAEGPRLDQLEVTVALLLEGGGDAVYRTLDDRAAQLLDAFAARDAANTYIVRFWLRAPSADWEKWHDRLRDEPRPLAPEVVDPLISHAFDAYSGLDEAEQERLPTQLASLVARRERDQEAGELPSFIEAAERALQAATWLSGAAEIAAQRRLYAVVRELRSLGTRIDAEVGGLLAHDLGRGLAAAPRDDAVADAVVDLASLLPDTWVLSVGHSIPATDFAADPAASATALKVRARLAHHLLEAGSELWTDETFAIAGTLAEEAVSAALPTADEAIQVWLRLQPSRAEVTRVLRAALARGSSGPALKDPLRDWAQTAERKDRTALLKTLIQWESDTSEWIRAVAAYEVAEKAVIDVLKNKMENAANERDRLRIARKARAFEPQTSAGQRQLADLVEWLLRSGRPKADIAVASAVAEGIGTEHRSGRRLSRAFREATDRHKTKLKGDQVSALRAAGIDLPKKWIGKRLLKRIGL